MKNYRDINEITEEVMRSIPLASKISKVEFEGVELAIYSSNPSYLVDNSKLIIDLAQRIKKRIAVRSEPSIRLDGVESLRIISNILNQVENLNVSQVSFDQIKGEVLIEVDRPDLLIRTREIRRKILLDTNWSPVILQSPPVGSTTVKAIRNILKEDSNAARRMDILREIGKRIHRKPSSSRHDIRVTAMGGYREVGRSSTLIHTGQSTFMVDCGINVGASSPDQQFPRFDLPEFDPSTLDGVVITHAHLDHCLPPLAPVLYADGKSRPINTCKVGDVVKTMDWKKGELVDSRISSVTKSNGHKKILRFKVDPVFSSSTLSLDKDRRMNNSPVLSCSPNHLLFTYRCGVFHEVRADEISEDDWLPFLDNKAELSSSSDIDERVMPVRGSDIIMLFNELDILPQILSLLERLGKSDNLAGFHDSILTRQQLSLVISSLKQTHSQNRSQISSEDSFSQQSSVRFVNKQNYEQLHMLEYVLIHLTQLYENTSVMWLPISSIQYDKNPYPVLYDIEVETFRNFVTNNVIVHNSGFVPYLFKFGFKGAVYATRATLDMMVMLQRDYLDIAQKEGMMKPYSEHDIRELVLHTIVLDYGVVVDIAPDVRLTMHNAGHIVGSAMPHLNIGDGKYNLAFAQDFKYADSRLLDCAVDKFPRLDAIFIESTYGLPQDVLPSRRECEVKLQEILSDVLGSGGHVLIPVLAVGRAQELMLIIEHLMTHGTIPEVPIYLDGMIKEATAITATHPTFLSRRLQEKISTNANPFLSSFFHQVDGGRTQRDEIIGGQPCVILSTSGMLTGGASLYYFQRLIDNPKHAVIFVSYQGRGTLGEKVLKGIQRLPLIIDNRQHIVNVKIQIYSINGFTGHSDRKELSRFIKQLSPRPRSYVFIHGEERKCLALASHTRKTTKSEALVPKIGSTVVLN